MKHVEKLNDVPAAQHFVILRQRSISITGDERSRTHPGHGYPASTEQFLDYSCYENRADWAAEIDRLTRARESFRAIIATSPKITTTITVDVNAA